MRQYLAKQRRGPKRTGRTGPPAKASKLRIDHPEAAARAFIGLLIGDILLRRLISPASRMSQKTVEEHVERSVHLFLTGARHRT